MLLVVEEKRSFVEAQIRDALYNMPADQRPAVQGKQDLDGRRCCRTSSNCRRKW